MPGKSLVMLRSFIASLISPSLSVFSEVLISVVINPSLQFDEFSNPAEASKTCWGQGQDVPLGHSQASLGSQSAPGREGGDPFIFLRQISFSLVTTGVHLSGCVSRAQPSLELFWPQAVTSEKL